jgi:hypothetical protein
MQLVQKLPGHGELSGHVIFLEHYSDSLMFADDLRIAAKLQGKAVRVVTRAREMPT